MRGDGSEHWPTKTPFLAAALARRRRKLFHRLLLTRKSIETLIECYMQDFYGAVQIHTKPTLITKRGKQVPGKKCWKAMWAGRVSGGCVTWRLEPAGGGGGARCALAAHPQSSAGTWLEKHSATPFHIKSSWPSYMALECAVKVFVRQLLEARIDQTFGGRSE